MAAVDLNVELECTVRQEATGLAVGYAVRNAAGKEIGIFNRIPTFALDGSIEFLSRTVYVWLEESVLHLSKMVLPVPEGLQVAGRSVPGVTRLPDGETFREEFVLGTPVPVNHPYRRALLVAESPRAEIVAVDPRAAQTVVLSIGIFPVGPEIQLLPASPAWPGVFQVMPPGVAAAAQMVLTASVKTAKPVIVLDNRAVARAGS